MGQCIKSATSVEDQPLGAEVLPKPETLEATSSKMMELLKDLQKSMQQVAQEVTDIFELESTAADEILEDPLVPSKRAKSNPFLNEDLRITTAPSAA